MQNIERKIDSNMACALPLKAKVKTQIVRDYRDTTGSACRADFLDTNTKTVKQTYTSITDNKDIKFNRMTVNRNEKGGSHGKTSTARRIHVDSRSDNHRRSMFRRSNLGI